MTEPVFPQPEVQPQVPDIYGNYPEGEDPNVAENEPDSLVQQLFRHVGIVTVIDSLDPNQKTNASGGKDCADELYSDDGRYTHEDKADHGGDWGKHSDKDLDE